MASLDEELEEQERQREEKLNALSQQQRMEQAQQQQQRQEQNRQQRASSIKNQAKKAATSYAKKAARKAMWEFLAANPEIWLPALGIVLLIGVILSVVVVLFSFQGVACNNKYTRYGVILGMLAAPTSSGFISSLDKKFCGPAPGGRSGGGGASNTFGGLDIVITSAYRAGAIVAGTNRLSAHARGEAVDIALRNPTVPEGSTDPRIAQLVQIAKNAGFNPLVGDTLDEYTTPTEGASAGHIHVEFNLKSDGQTTYCDNTIVKNPPTDLVSLSSVNVDSSSTSDPRVRPCMLDAITEIFDAAAAVPPPTTP